jgi:hypothetical protein
MAPRDSGSCTYTQPNCGTTAPSHGYPAFNILMIIVDQMRAPRWLPQASVTGAKSGQAAIDAILPNIAAIRNHSFVFANYNVAATSCSPARATLLTGFATTASVPPTMRIAFRRHQRSLPTTRGRLLAPTPRQPATLTREILPISWATHTPVLRRPPTHPTFPPTRAVLPLLERNRACPSRRLPLTARLMTPRLRRLSGCGSGRPQRATGGSRPSAS